MLMKFKMMKHLKNNKLHRINDQLITNTYVKTSVLIPSVRGHVKLPYF
jgi:hypothetical protein